VNQICATRVAPEEAVFRPALLRNPSAGVLPEKRMIHPPGPCPYCQNSKTELRRRQIANGSFQFVDQCLTCGVVRSQPIRASEIKSPATVPAFDGDLIKRFNKRKEQQRQKESDQKRAQWFAEYTEYLLTPAWRAKRDAVLTRDRKTCLGCGAPATQVHHLTYEHVGNELLWELVSICNACHKRVHDDHDENH
jgi:5-methylcytosine-specific restriction endonuclease McrA